MPATDPMPIHAVDISHHQEDPLNFAVARKAGVKGVWHKATEGNSFVDITYDDRRPQVKAARVLFGAYHFARPQVGDAANQARHFLAVAKIVPGELIPMLDLETNDASLTRAQLTTWTKVFVETVKNEIGVAPILYNRFDLDDTCGCDLWMARYNDSNEPPDPAEPWKRWSVWQFSNGILGVPDSVAGLGHVDLNTFADGVTIDQLVIPSAVDHGHLRILTQNLSSGLTDEEVHEDVHKDAVSAGLIGWQGLDVTTVTQADYRDVILNRLPKFQHHLDQASTTGISWREILWEEIDSGTAPLHKATPKMLDDHGKPILPVDQRLTWALLRHQVTGTRVLVHNAQYVSRAWGERPRMSPEVQTLRQQIWDETNIAHRDWLIGQMAKHPNWPIIGFGAFNVRLDDKPPFDRVFNGRRVFYPVSKAAINQISLMPSDTWRWVVRDPDGDQLVGRNSSHTARRAVATLVKR